MTFRFAVAVVLLFLIPPPTVAWLTRRDGRHFRFFASHPWLTFWLSNAVFIVLFCLILFLTDRQYFSFAAVLLAPVAVLFVAAFALSAIQGLRLTWKKSRRNAAILELKENRE